MKDESFIYLKNLARALRLPFIAVSLFPFIAGTALDRSSFDWKGFIIGLVSVISVHLSANLMNDYCDSASGVDSKDTNYYVFFGGSKLIQEGVFSESFYLCIAIIFALLSAISVIILAVLLKNLNVLFFYVIIIFLAWSYSCKPLSLSYRSMGEFIIFVIFGPVLVCGGFFIQTGVLADMRSILVSVPFGFFTSAVLLANEIPDSLNDKAGGKKTLVAVWGREIAWVLYCIAVFLGFLSVIVINVLGYLNPLSLVCLILVIPVFKAALILRKCPFDKVLFAGSSKLTIVAHSGVSLAVVLGIFMK